MNNQTVTYDKQIPQSKLMAVRKAAARYVTGPLVRLIAKTKATPNDLTWIGFTVIAAGAALVVSGHMLAAGFVVLGASFFDLLDGALARGTNRVTRYGSVLDSSLDRAAESLLFGGIAAFYALHPSSQSTAIILLSVIAMSTSFLVSYVRARAEGAGLKCEVGLLTRAERIGLLVIGLWFSGINYALVIILSIIALLSLITAGQRLSCVRQQTKSE
ncbi:MAG: CDP-alcohol phosphatidyltransferase family protein [Dehalococcoidales bacterium]|nr:CDP-alcohol phosphatidyltransferase family protein [Dehalococcoidales bacterium]